jgi:hypothetical protein
MGLTISPEASAHSQAHSGDVSALCLLRVPDAVSGIERTVVLAGIGSQLLAYDLCSGQLLFCHRVMPDGMHLHGIAAERPASGGWDALLALHGDRHACVASLHLRDAPRAEVLWALPALRSWTLDARLTLLGAGPASRALVAVGMCDNSVEVHSLGLGAQQAAAQQPPATLLLRAESTERCLLYSLHLWTRLQASCTHVHFLDQPSAAPGGLADCSRPRAGSCCLGWKKGNVDSSSGAACLRAGQRRRVLRSCRRHSLPRCAGLGDARAGCCRRWQPRRPSRRDGTGQRGWRRGTGARAAPAQGAQGLHPQVRAVHRRPAASQQQASSCRAGAATRLAPAAAPPSHFLRSGGTVLRLLPRTC